MSINWKSFGQAGIVGVVLVVVMVGVMSLFDGGPSRDEWNAQVEAEYAMFVDGENFASLRCDGSLLYLEVAPAVPASECPMIARAWAGKFSRYKAQYGTGSNVTVFVTRDGGVVAEAQGARGLPQSSG